MARAAAVHAGAAIEDISMVPRLLIQGELGKTNIIEYAEAAQPDAWKVLTNVVVAINPCVFVDLSAVGVGRRFYRLAVSDNPDPARWVWIPPGTFTMGSPSSEPDRDPDEGPQTVVTLTRGFWMGKYEVTRGEYQAVMGGNNPSNFQGDLNLPVHTVSWNDATNYCAELTRRERAAGRLPSGYAYRLPTEAEWEYACRAGTTTATAFGDTLSSTQANFHGDFPYNGAAKGPYLQGTAPVGSYAPNGWGLYDMHGNVWEWCLDWRTDSLPGGSVTDPTGPSSGTKRVNRGGSWGFYGRYCRSANRDGDQPSYLEIILGFRVALAAVP